MKKKVILSIISLFAPFHFVQAKNPIKLKDKSIVVYGNDERYDLNNLPIDLMSKRQEQISTWSKSISAMIKISDMQQGPYDIFFTLEGKTLGEEYNLCEEERFREQLSVANCTGFLVAPDLMITAGHCVDKKKSCEKYAWVFDFKSEQVNLISKAPFVWKKDVYYCKEIVAFKYEDLGIDYSVIRLDRKVKDRRPLKIRTKGKINNNAQLVALGHPSGLPLKVADKGKIRENSQKDFFIANIDTFQGNSGSPVFSWDSGLVEGILVRGDKDYEFDESLGCNKAKVCEMNKCRGEDVIRSHHFLTNLF